jgi:hypothetical protein
MEAQIGELNRMRQNHGRIRSAFMALIGHRPGPWADRRATRHFKVSNRISRTGRRLLMFINSHFDRHEGASRARDRAPPCSACPSPVPRLMSPPMLPASRCVFEATGVSHFWICVKVGRLAVLASGSVIFEGAGKRLHFPIDRIRFILHRYFERIDKAAEIFTALNTSYVFAFENNEDRAGFYRAIAERWRAPPRGRSKSDFFRELQEKCDGCIQNQPAARLFKSLGLTERWQNHEITTFSYLYYINVLGGRSYRRLAHYPFYPWLIREMNAPVIDLEAEIYRDLTKPPLALSPPRLAEFFVELAERKKEGEDSPLGRVREQPSSHGGLMALFVRVEPFTTAHIAFQSGLFDTRIEWSMPLHNAGLHGQGFLREAPPEFFTLPSVLLNENGFDLGRPPVDLRPGTDWQTGDIELPMWAATARQYTETQRIALDSSPVSATIGDWIDLMFGIYQRAADKGNSWWPYALLGGDLGQSDAIMSELFGVLPIQIFQKEHGGRGPFPPPRFRSVDSGKFEGNVIAIKKGIVFCDNGRAYDFLSEIDSWVCRCRGKVFGVAREWGIVVYGSGRENCITVDCKGTQNSLYHETSLITCAAIIGGEYLLTGGTDCAIRVYRLPDRVLVSTSAHQMGRLIAVGGNVDVGLVVSIDNGFSMVLETLFDHRFINYVQLEGVEHCQPKIAVFKSGTIAIGFATEVKFFDPRGIFQANISVRHELQQMEKYYDFGGRELLIVVDSADVVIVDLTTFTLLPEFKQTRTAPRACGLKRQRAVLVSTKGQSFKVCPFTVPSTIGARRESS